MSCITQAQFDAADLIVRRQIAIRHFDDEERLVLKHFVERSFQLGRVAAFFRSFRQLAIVCGREPQWRGHANEAFQRLLEKRVLVEYHPQWYGVNINFLEWRVEVVKTADNFDEEQSLLHEPKLRELLAECFVNSSGEKILTADNREPIAIPVTDRGRDAGPALSSEHVNEPVENISPPASSEQKKTEVDWKRFRQALDEGRAAEEFPEPASVPLKGTPGTPSVPQNHQQVFPTPKCSPERNTAKPNNGAAMAASVPLKGTFPYIASLASCTKARLATAAAFVPPKGTPANQKSVFAYRWLQEVDTTLDLKVARFDEKWKKLCSTDPDYILTTLKTVLEKQIKRDGDVIKPLALLAKAAREAGRMR